LAFSVGDQGTDRSMTGLVRAAFVVGSSDRNGQSAGVELIRDPSQEGLAATATRVLGHPPGSCQVCAAPPLSPDSQLFLRLLGLQDSRGWRKAASALGLIPSALRRRP